MNIKPEELVSLALKAREYAYAPYSGFAVGAAFLTTGGTVYTGCNVENSSYGLTMCAERVALFTAVAQGERNFAALAMAAGTEVYCSPCGACRQVFVEFGGDLKIYMANCHGAYKETTATQLVPEAFALALE